MYKTKIDWCDTSWNPVTGCLHGCEYCYARGIAERFGSHLRGETTVMKEDGAIIATADMLHVLDKPVRNTDTYEYMRIAGISAGRIQPYPYDFEPTFHRYKLDDPQHWKRPRTIFVCSMADLFGDWVPDEWIKDVFDACRKAPWHRYLFLTKNPDRYDMLEDAGMITPADKNFWLGSTVTDMNRDRLHWNRSLNTFMSCEPMLAPWNPAGKPNEKYRGGLPKWVIFGAETGNRKGKVIPKKEWLDNAVQMCRNMGAAVFMKESLREIMGNDFIQEFPWGGSEG